MAAIVNYFVSVSILHLKFFVGVDILSRVLKLWLGCLPFRRCCRGESYSMVRTGPGKPGKSWNLTICIPGLESHGIFVQVMESHGI